MYIGQPSSGHWDWKLSELEMLMNIGQPLSRHLDWNLNELEMLVYRSAVIQAFRLEAQ